MASSGEKNTTRTVKLSTGGSMPVIGLGTWQSSQSKVGNAVEVALKHGYRHIDTARAYGNEKEVGEGIRKSGVPRSDIWVTTKLDNPHHHRAAAALDDSLKDLGLEYVDLYLIHWPSSTDPDDLTKHLPDWDYVKTWHEMQKLHASGKARNIGVCNFGITHLTKLLDHPATTIKPAVNQIELHPGNPSPKLVDFAVSKGIHCTAYSCMGSTDSPLFNADVLVNLAKKKDRTVQQVLIMWSLQRGFSVIPKSVTPDRIKANFELDGWSLTDDEVKEIGAIKDRFKVCDGLFLPAGVKVFLGDDE